MLMRYHFGFGVGHVYSHRPATNGSDHSHENLERDLRIPGKESWKCDASNGSAESSRVLEGRINCVGLLRTVGTGIIHLTF